MNRIPNPSCMAFDFEQWMQLAKDDPAGFETRRRKVIEAFVEERPMQNQQPLRRLQWRIDMEIRCGGSPLAACLRLHKLMMDSLQRQQKAIDALLRGKKIAPSREGGGHNVVSLPPRRQS